MGKLRLKRNRWADNFPVSRLIATMVQTYSLHDVPTSEQDELNKKCRHCCIEGKQSDDVAFFCLTCNESLCKYCCTAHNKFKETRRHTVLPTEQLPKDMSIFKRMNKMCHCNVHADRKIDYICNNCNSLLCSICATMDHRQHNLTRIDTIDIHGIRTHLEAQAKEASLLQLSVQVESNKIIMDVEKLENESAKVKCSISEHFGKLFSSITRVQNEFDTKLCAQMDKEVSNYVKSIPEYTRVVSELNALKATTKLVLMHGSIQQTIVCLNVTKKETLQLRNKIQCQSENIQSCQVNGHKILQKIAQINTAVDTLVSISAQLFEKMDKNGGSGIPIDSNQVDTVYKRNASGPDIPIRKIVLHTKAKTSKISGRSVLVPTFEDKSFPHKCIETDTVVKKEICIGTEPVRTSDVDQQIQDVAHRRNCVGHDNVLKINKSVQTLNGLDNISYRRLEDEICICVSSIVLLLIGLVIWLKMSYDTLTGRVGS